MPSLILLAPTPLLLLISLHDLRHRRIRNRDLAMTAVVVGVVIAVVGAVEHRPTAGAAAAGAALAAAPLVVAWLSRPSGIGGGDVKLAIVVGALVGLVHPYLALAVVALALVVTLVALKVLKTGAAPLAPALVLAGVAALIARAL